MIKFTWEIKFRGLPDKKSTVYEHFARLKADFMADYGRFSQIFPTQGGGGLPSPLSPTPMAVDDWWNNKVEKRFFQKKHFLCSPKTSNRLDFEGKGCALVRPSLQIVKRSIPFMCIFVKGQTELSDAGSS